MTWKAPPKPPGQWRAHDYDFQERGKWLRLSKTGNTDEECDEKAIRFITTRKSGAVTIIIRCPDTVIWERVEHLNDAYLEQRRKQCPVHHPHVP